MAQTILKEELEQNDIVIIIPEDVEIKEIIKEKIEQKPKKKFFKKYSKYHKNQIDINKLKNKLDANTYRGGFFLAR
ncbi:hypothetical protein LCGC14_0566070 [marine sediment metagenome]|uniref:Uncharacterized protein n=1 Tax=marine sediment metagenome TaxID=412755 RepID=A0A0F9RQT2_9ZZZZ